MSYTERTLEKKIREAAGYSPVIMVCGPTHVGKTTMLCHIISELGIKDIARVSLRNLDSLNLAVNDPVLFFDRHKPPVMIEEIQLAPSLLPTIQYLVDHEQDMGRSRGGIIWLTSSQKFTHMNNVTESLAGRCTVFNLSSLSAEEMEGIDAGVFNPDIEALKERTKRFSPKSEDDIYERIFLGGMPAPCLSPDIDMGKYYMDYVNLYLQRDISEYMRVNNLYDFREFLSYMASHSGQELNYYGFAQNLRVSAPTVKKWVMALDALGIICVIPPYMICQSKRIVKSSKFFFMDTGLMSYLCGYKSPEEISAGKLAESFLETYAVSEITKSYIGAGKNPEFYHYRDIDMKEIDLIIQSADKIYPMGIKRNILPQKPCRDTDVLHKYGVDMHTQPAITICLTDTLVPCANNTWLYPISAL